MAPKAIHLKRDVQNIYITVDQLFEAAFGPMPREYRHKSLLGWRPVQLDAVPETGTAKHALHDPGQYPEVFSPGTKVYETDELIIVEVELPPIEEESLYLEISGDILMIRGNQIVPKRPNHPNSQKQSIKKVYRYVQLPVPVKPGQVRARLEGSTVRVMISKQNDK